VTTRRYKPYLAHKDSGVEWLGEIPAHWETVSLKRVASIRYGLGEPPKLLAEGLPFIRATNVTKGRIIDRDMQYVDPADVPWNRNPALRTGDIIVVRSGAYTGDSAIIPEPYDGAIAGYDMVVRVWRGRSKFLAWALLSRYVLNVQVELASLRAAQPHLNAEELGTVAILFPPDSEQRAIAAFLDRETARIDALVAKKERLIALLQEQRTSLITRAVTRGLDRTVPTKDSGVEWLGEIPAHWEVKRLWHLTPSDRRIMYGIVLPGPNVDDGIPIVKGGDVSLERLRLDSLNRTTREIESGYVRSRLRGGDLVYAIRGSIGEVAMVPAELEGANLTQDAARIAYASATHGPWLVHALKSSAVFAQLEAGALGATIRGINIRDLKRASMAVPPRSEQRAIAAFLDRETARIDALVAKVREAIERLKELRTALISAAVTGTIDVREEARA